MSKRQQVKAPMSVLEDAASMLPERSLYDSAPVKGRLLSKVIKFNDVYLRVFSIGYLSVALERSTATVRRWQRMELLPPPIITTMDGARWYLREEIQLYTRLTKQHGLHTGNSIEETGFPSAAKAEIAKLRDTLTRTVAKKENTAANTKKG